MDGCADYEVLKANQRYFLGLGLERIQELEQPKNFGLQEVPDRECDNPPKFLDNLQDVELDEHDDVRFELKVCCPLG